MTEPLLSLRNLQVAFTRDGRLVPTVRGVSFDLAAGETIGIVGESGSGKSVTMLAIMGLLASTSASVTAERIDFAGRDLAAMSDAERRAIRGRELAMIFQDPLVALNPVLRVGYQIAEVFRRHLKLPREEARARAIELLARVGVPDPSARIDQYPHQFSGGMRQRIMIAMALAAGPRLLIADEPTTALDVTVQADIVHLLKELQRQSGMAMIWVTHDLALLARVADRVLVMYAGRIVEEAAAATLYAMPQHPYAAGLLGSMPRLNRARVARQRAIPGAPPDLAALPAGCPFAPRCAHALAACADLEPALAATGVDGGRAACGVLPYRSVAAGHSPGAFR